MREPIRGDILRIDRGNYWHYAVYDNVKRVIHYTSKGSDTSGENIVSETDFEHFLRGGNSFEIVIFPERFIDDRTYIKGVMPGSYHGFANTRDIFDLLFGVAKIVTSTSLAIARVYEELKALNYRLIEPDEVIARAEKKLGENKYNLMLNNCEHFAVWCKTDVYDSHQTSMYRHLKKLEKLLEEYESNKIWGEKRTKIVPWV